MCQFRRYLFLLLWGVGWVNAATLKLEAEGLSTMSIDQFIESVALGKYADLKIDYFQVYGTEATKLKRSLFQNGRWGNYAYTSWQLSWQYQCRPVLNGYKLANIKLNKHIVIEFPLWRDKEQASLTLKKRWQVFQKLLMRHELGHAQFAIAAQKDIQQQLVALAVNSSCAVLLAQANSLAEQTANQYKKAEKSYDKNAPGLSF